MNSSFTDFLQRRRSVVAKKMSGLPPSADDLETILSCALRVPDHSNVQPWRVVVLEGQRRADFDTGVVLPAARQRAADQQQEFSDELAQLESHRMQRGGVVVAVLCTPQLPHKIPLWEQQLSSAAVCMQLLNAAQALGYAAQWLTEWLAYDRSIIEALGSQSEHDQLAGFIHISQMQELPQERKRPDPLQIISRW